MSRGEFAAAKLSDERLNDLLHDAELLVEGASHGLRVPTIQWEDDVLVALRELKEKRDALAAYWRGATGDVPRG